MFLFWFLVCILVRECRFRFPFFCYSVLDFRFAYRIVGIDGVMGFEMSSDDALLGTLVFMSFSNF